MLKSPVIRNANWIIGCRILRGLVQLVVGMLTARYLGPSDYGLISFAASVTAFAVPVMQLGFPATLVQEYVQRPDQAGEIMGTALVLNLISGICAAAGVTAFAAGAAGDDRMAVLVCALYSAGLVLQALELVQYWFQAELAAKYASLAMLWGYLAVSGYRIFLLAMGKSAAWFALSHGVEFAVAGVVMLVQCRRRGLGKLRFRTDTARGLLSRSRYYVPAALLVACFQNTDHVMLKLLAGDGANGLYTCAAACAGMTSFLYGAVVDSLRPVILASRKESRQAFEETMTGLYCVLNLLAVGQSAVFTLLAGPIVELLYGGDFAGAVPVLRILVWNTAFSCMGAARDVWLLAQEKHSLLWRINLVGVAGNILMNILLIPRWGPAGAAAASVLTQFLTNFAVGFGIPAMRENQRLLLKGLQPAGIQNLLKRLRE